MSDLPIQQTSFAAVVPKFTTKPHIVFLNDKKNNIFISIDMPEETAHFIRCKGYYVNEAYLDNKDMLKLIKEKVDTDKDSILECSFSTTGYVKMLQSLIFKQK